MLLATTICCIATNDANATQGDTKPVTQQAPGLATRPLLTENSSSPTAAVNASVATTNASNNVSNPVSPHIIAAPTTNNSIATVINKITSDNTTFTTQKPVDTTIKSTTLEPTSSTTKPTPPLETTTSSTTVAPSTTTDNTHTVSSTPVTTAVPVSTKVAPPYKERHFDGLSFLEGITLAICLMAIGAFSWKFYRTFNERNYRTL